MKKKIVTISATHFVGYFDFVMGIDVILIRGSEYECTRSLPRFQQEYPQKQVYVDRIPTGVR